MKKCKRCKKEKDIVKDYIICWDCLIELDINPLLVMTKGDGAIAVDALVKLN